MLWLLIVIDVAVLLFGIIVAYQCIKWRSIEKRFYNTLRYFGMTRNEIKKYY